MKRFLIPAALAACTMMGPATADSYRWLDESGEINYSQLPPTGAGPATRIPPPPPPAEPKALPTIEERMQGFHDRREKAAIARDEARRASARAAHREESCRRARHNLLGLQGGRKQLFRDERGVVRRYTQAQLDERVRSQQAIVDRDCPK